jgi:hypothetical protein
VDIVGIATTHLKRGFFMELTAAGVRKFLNEKYPAQTPREHAYVSIVLALLESQETMEAQLKGLAELFGLLCTALEVDPKQLLALKDAPKTKVEGPPAPVEGTAGPTDKTPFPAGFSTSAPPGTPPKATVSAPIVEDMTPNAQSGPAVNARPNIAPAPQNGAK